MSATISWAPTRSDFWNDPDLWKGIADPRKQMCWDEREIPAPPPPPKPGEIRWYVGVGICDPSQKVRMKPAKREVIAIAWDCRRDGFIVRYADRTQRFVAEETLMTPDELYHLRYVERAI